MKSKHPRTPLLSTALIITLLVSHSASAADLLWGSNLGTGPWDWNTGGNWALGTAPTTSTDRADLRKDWTDLATPTINLSAPTTTNGIFYYDTSGTAVAMTIANGGNAANTLTLGGTTPSTPYIETSSNLTISAIILGTQGVTKGGSSTLTLSGVNTYSGGTIVSAGTLQIGSISTTNGTAVTGGATGIGNVTTGTGLTKLNNLSAMTWYVPTLTLQGTTELGSGSRLTTTIGTLELSSGTRVLNVNGKFSAVTGGNTLTSEVTGGGQWEMNKIAIQTATSAIQNGTLSLQSTNGAATPANPAMMSILGPTNWTNASLIIGANNMLMFNGTSSASANALGTSDTTSPATTVDGYLNLAASTYTASGKNFKVQSLAGSGKVFASMLAANTFPATLTINGITGSTSFSGLLANGPGTGTLSLTKNGVSTQILSGANTYTGLTTVSSGTLSLIGSGTVGSGAGLTMSGGTLALGGTSQTVGAVSITSAAASGNTLENGSLTGMVNTAYAVSNATGNAVVTANLLASGTAGLTKTGAGTLTLSGANTYTGLTTLSGGVIDIGLMSGASLGGGGLIFANAAVLQGNGTFARNFSNSLIPGDNQISVNNGSASSSGGFAAKGGPLSVNFGGAGALLQISSGSYRFGQGFVFGSASADNKVTVVNPLSLGGGSRTFTVNAGLGGDSAELAGAVSDSSATGITKAGTGLLVLKGLNTYFGNTLVNAGTLELADNAQLKFVIGATSGTNNSISGAGTMLINGGFVIDTTAAAALTTGSWTLVNVPSLTGPYGATFSVVGFTDAGSDKWTMVNGTQAWTFDETTGTLTLAVAATANYASWAIDKGITGQPANGDYDSDGLSNLIEYALGLDPKVSDVPPGVVTNNGKTITFTKGLAAKTNGDVSYAIETSTDLGISPNPWTVATTPDLTETADTIAITLPVGPAKNFARLKVIQP